MSLKEAQIQNINREWDINISWGSQTRISLKLPYIPYYLSFHQHGQGQKPPVE